MKKSPLFLLQSVYSLNRFNTMKPPLHLLAVTVVLIIALVWQPGQAQESRTAIPPNYHKELSQAKQHQLSRRRQLMKPGDSAAEYGDYDVHFYDLDLAFDFGERRIIGEVLIGGEAIRDNVNSITLNLYNNLQIIRVEGDVSGFLHKYDRVAVFLREPLSLGEEFAITIRYSGQPVAAGFQGLAFSSHSGGPVISSLSEPYSARSWWPCKDIPADKADSANISITVADTLTPVSNGTLADTQSHGDGTHTYHWEVRYPITTYLISVAISNYRYFSDEYTTCTGAKMPLDYYIFPFQDSETTRTRILETNRMLEEFADLFGEYPFLAEKYGMASFSWGGAMEHQTISSMGLYSQSIIAHELAHQWWGDWVTMGSFHHIWLNEGFASYSEALYYEAIHGEEFYHNYMQRMAYRGNGTVFVQDTTDVRRIFNANLSYDKGAYILHMLRHVVGDSVFFEGLRKYGQTHAYGTAVTEDFRAIMEQVSGRDLETFFEQWIYRSGVPQYEYCSWTDSGEEGITVHLEINQTQDTRVTPIFRMPIDLLFAGDRGRSRTVTVQNSQQSQQYTFSLPWEPTSVRLDPDGWILKCANKVNVALDRSGCAPLDEFALASNYPNPFNGETLIRFAIPRTGQVFGVIYNLRGERVKTLINARMEPGQHAVLWDGTGAAGEGVPSGVYFFRLQTRDRYAVDKMMYLK